MRATPFVNRTHVKMNVHNSMRGRWGSLFLATLLPMLATGVISYFTVDRIQTQISDAPLAEALPLTIGISLASILVNAFVKMPMSVKMSGIFLASLKTNEKPNLAEVFSCFDTGYFASVRKLLPYLNRLEGLNLLSTLLVFVPNAGLLSLAVQFIYWQRSLAYMFFPYILAENPTMNGKDALKYSVHITSGRLLELLELQLSYIGWAVFAVVTFGFGLIYALPFIEMTTSSYYVALKRMASSPNYLKTDFEIKDDAQ